jgi:hypothetical protein
MYSEESYNNIYTDTMIDNVMSLVEIVKSYKLEQNNLFKVTPTYEGMNMFMAIVFGKKPKNYILE